MDMRENGAQALFASELLSALAVTAPACRPGSRSAG